VHGDIRGLNAAFAEGGASRFFDWDFGGELDAGVTFPHGYVPFLADGHRRDRKGEAISVVDDWYALTSLVLRFHEMYTPNADRGSSQTRYELIDFPHGLPDEEVDVLGHAEKLETFLRKAAQDGSTMRLDGEYEAKLQRMGYQSPADATGNPPSKHF
jgi:hypothetical protein